jgi:membrane-associated phospholipid phosphatase
MTPVLVTALIAAAAVVATYGLLTLLRFPRAERAAAPGGPLETPAAAAVPLAGGAVALSALAIAGLTLGLLARGIERHTFLVRWDETVERWASDNAGAAGTAILRTITHLGDTVVVLGFGGATAALLLARGRRRLALFTVTVVLGQWGLANLIKEVVARARPDLDPLAPFSGFSFPSGHATAAAATYLALALVVAVVKPGWNARLIIAIGVAIATVVAASRAMLGVHWFSDVLGGLVLGWSWCLICAWIYRVVRTSVLADPSPDLTVSD